MPAPGFGRTVPLPTPPAPAPSPNGRLNGLDAATSNQASADQAKLVQDPVTGLWQDPSNRAVFQLVNGQYVPVHDLNMTAQVARNIALSQQYGGLGKDYDAALRATMAQQNSLADAYRRTISDPNAPSVAREQLQQALNASENQQLSQAAGASGGNAFIARSNAANNMASLAAKAGQAGAELRAGEVATAQQGLGQTLGALGSEAGGGISTYTGLGRDYANLAANIGNAGNANATARRGQNFQLGEDLTKMIGAGASGATNPTGAAAAA